MSLTKTGIIAWLRTWFDDLYVGKVSGKGLSTNDYTTTEKNKLSGIESQANKTVVDSSLSSTSTNPVQNKVIFDNFVLVEDYEIDTVSNNIPIKISSQTGQYLRGMGFSDGDSIESVLEEFAGRISEMQTQWDTVYPVGAIYMSVNSTNPSTLFGGTWVQLKDTFLLASGDTYSNGSTGGEATHTLTVDEIASHNHSQNAHSHSNARGSGWRFIQGQSGAMARRQVGSSGTNRGYAVTTDSTSSNAAIDFNVETATATATNNSTGGSQAHNNMPPYLVVYMWKRTG